MCLLYCLLSVLQVTVEELKTFWQHPEADLCNQSQERFPWGWGQATGLDREMIFHSVSTNDFL